MTATFGVAVAAPAVVERDDLMRAADEAMYRGKSEGRDQVVAHRAILRPAA